MKTVPCKECGSVMGLVREAPRWELYKCFSCRHVMGRFHEELKEHEFEDATREMDTYAATLLDEELQSMSAEGLTRLFCERNEKQKVSEDVIAPTQTRPMGRGGSCDWLNALQSFEFGACRILERDGGRTSLECIGKYGIYRAFVDAHAATFVFQWIIRHASIAHLNRQRQDDLVMRVAQASPRVELEFKEDMARVRVQHVGILDDYDLAVANAVREIDTVIPILLSTVERN